MITICLTKNQSCCVDDVDADLASVNWYAKFFKKYANGGNYLAARSVYFGNGKQSTELMHRVILSRVLGRTLSSKEMVDHKDLNPLNNTRKNLRLANRTQNTANRATPKSNTTGFKGVHFDKKSGKWKAKITVNKVQRHLGYFTTPTAAFEAYKRESLKAFGEFARFE